jgi:hypothetical protein
MFHERNFETFWRLILLCLGRFTDILDSGDQVFDILGEVLFLVSPASKYISI